MQQTNHAAAQTNCNGRLQQPLKSGFNRISTADDVIKGLDVAGKIAIVTGGTAGIGLETTKVLAAAGVTVIVPARNIDKARRNLGDIDNVELATMDLMDPDSINNFADKFLESGRPLHMLINNAGIMWVPLKRDARGIESQLATNYIAQFHLSARLWPALIKANGSRVVNVSSQGHQFGPFNFEDPNFLHRQYETLQAYGQSKTASNLFSVELDNRGKKSKVRTYSLHPGAIGSTELARDADPQLLINMGFFDAQGNMLPEVAASLKTVSQGAATTIWCASNPVLDHIGGVYCEDCDIANLVEGKSLEASGGVSLYSLDEANAKRLWSWTEEITGISFQF